MNLGAALAGGNGRRRADDFYPTPPEATVALINATGQYIEYTVHEPACGDGAMAKVLEWYGFGVIATDLVYRGYGIGGIDFLETGPASAFIITNPPFKLAAAFIETAMTRDPQPAYLALLLKSQFANADSRVSLFERYPPKQVLPLAWRLDFTGGGAPTMDCTWFVWGSNVPHKPLQPLRKPNLGVLA